MTLLRFAWDPVRAARWHVALLLLLATGGAASAADAVGDAAAVQAFEKASGAQFLEQYWRRHPDAAIAAGYYAVAEELPAPDAQFRAELLQFLRAADARLLAIDPAGLPAAQRTDRALLDNTLRAEIWQLSEKRDWEWDPSNYNVAEAFSLLLNTPYAPLEQRLRTVLVRLGKVPAYYAAARASIGVPTREHTQLAIEQNRGALAVFGDDLARQVAAAQLTDAEKDLFARRSADARAAMEGFVAWLQGRDRELAAGGARSFRLGAALYERQFAFDIATGASAESLYRRALAEKETLLGRMDLLADELWPKVFPDAPAPAERLQKIGAVISRLSEQHAPAEGFTDEVRRLIPQMEQWVRDHRLLELDPTRPLQVRTTPAYKQGVTAASIDAPGPYDPTAPTFFNVTPLDDRDAQRAESFLREYNRWILPVLVMHEAVPGHYVQLLHANKSPSRIKSLFGNGAMIEGWAVYSERLMIESGYGDDTAEQWLMYDKFNLRTVCNTILDYGVHVQGMTQEQARHLLVDEAFQTPEQAREKWRRVSLTSVQLTSYFAGYSAIYDLRERLKREYGTRFDLRRFHERFLGYGSAPVSMIAELMAAEGP